MKRKILFFLFLSMFVLHCGSFGKESPAEIKTYIEKIDKIVSAKNHSHLKETDQKFLKKKDI